MRKLLLATANKLQFSLFACLLSSTVVAQGVGSIVDSPAFTPGQAQSSAASPQTANNDGMLLLLEQNRQLQTELQALREMVEQLNSELRRMQRDSLSRYSSTDERLSSLEAAPANPVVRAPSSTDLTPGRLSVITQPNARSAQDAPALPVSGVEPVSRGRVRATLEPAVLSEQQLYQMANESVMNNEFQQSVAEFNQYLDIYPDGRFAINAHYWKGQAFLNLQRYDEAREAYEIIMNQYDATEPKYPDAMYGLAGAYEGLGNIEQARQLLNDIKEQFPLSGVANLADTRLLDLN